MSNNPSSQANIMGSLPIPQLLLKMAPPLMVAMIVQGLYNLVDSIFVAQICEDALTAVSLVFPVDNLMISFAVGTGVGINAMLSRRLGENRREDAEKIANVGVLLAVLSSIVFAVLGLLFSRTFFTMQVDDPTIIEYGSDYLTIVSVFSIGVFMEITAERILQSTGHSMQTMLTQLVGAVCNIILDPILIFGWFGLPAMGVKGAAYATVIGRCLGAALGFILNHHCNREVRLSLKKIRWQNTIVKEIYSIGFPSILMMSVGSVMAYLMNQILLAFVSTAAAIFGVFSKISNFFLMPVFGLNNAVVPIVSFNYGAQNRGRIRETVRLSTITATILVVIGFIVVELFPAPLLTFFKASEGMLTIGVPALKILFLPFPIIGFSIVASSVFQALGKGTYSLWASLLRQIVILIPTAYLLSLTGNLSAVWYSVLISEVVCFLFSILLLRRVWHLMDSFPQ